MLAIGIDERVFTDPFLRKKVLEYGGAFDSTHIVCRSSDPMRRVEEDGGVIFYPVYSRAAFTFPLKAWFLGKKILTKTSGRWLISSDSPFEVGFMSWLLARKFRGHLFIQIHTDFMSPYFRCGSFKDRIRYYLARLVVPRADCLRVVSKRIEQSLVNAWKLDFPPGGETRFGGPREVRLPKITVLPIVTEVDKFLNAERSAATDERFKNYDFKMVAVGRFMDKEKNFSMLIDVMREFVKICSKALLVLVGDGPDKKKYESRIMNYGLERSIIIEKWRDDLPSFLKSFDLFLMPSNYEGWGRAAIEAMAAGLPVVMTDVGLAGEVVRNGENGTIVPVGDMEAMLVAVTELYQNQEKKARFSRNNIESVKKLEPKTESEYFMIYKNLLYDCLQKF